MSPLHVSCAARGPYVKLSAVMLASVIDHAGEPVEVHYLHAPDVPDAELDALRAMVEAEDAAIELLPIGEDRLSGLPTVEEFTSAMWYRVLLPELLPAVERVLYLDIDTLVLDSLQPLWQVGLDGYLLGAVDNVFQHNHVDRPRRLGIPAGQPYFNSGVLLMNLEEMRRSGSSDAIRECARLRGAELEWPDQDALNLVLGPRRLPLEPRWNCMNSVIKFAAAADSFAPEELAAARSRPAIRHFEGPGPNKPWHPRCDDPLRGAWSDYLARTPWPDLSIPDGGGERARRQGFLGRAWRARRGRG